MAKVSMFIYAENAFPENAPQGSKPQTPKLHLMNPQQILRPMFIPGLFSFSAVFGIIDFDISVPHNIKFKFYDPKGNVLIDTGNGLPIPSLRDQIVDEEDMVPLPDNLRGFISNIDLKNVVFNSSGIYKSELFFDDESLGIYEINVFGMKNNVNP